MIHVKLLGVKSKGSRRGGWIHVNLLVVRSKGSRWGGWLGAILAKFGVVIINIYYIYLLSIIIFRRIR